MANTFVSLRRLQQFYNGLKNKFALKSDIKTPDWNAQAITDETSGETTYEDGYIENKPAIMGDIGKSSVNLNTHKINAGYATGGSSTHIGGGYVYQSGMLKISGEANTVTYNYIQNTGYSLDFLDTFLSNITLLDNNLRIFVGSYSSDILQVGVVGIDTTNHTITVEETLSAEALENAICGLSVYSRASGSSSISFCGGQAYGAGSVASYGSIAKGITSTSLGFRNVVNGKYAFAHGNQNIVDGNYSNAFGDSNNVSNSSSFANGLGNKVSNSYAHAEGVHTTASGYCSHSDGKATLASNYYSYANGVSTISSGIASSAENFFTIASGKGSHAEGNSAVFSSIKLSGTANSLTYTFSDDSLETMEAFVELGFHYNNRLKVSTTQVATLFTVYLNELPTVQNIDIENKTITVDKAIYTIDVTDSKPWFIVCNRANGIGSHSEGQSTLALGYSSHAEGLYSSATGIGSHSEGNGTRAAGDNSHAQGEETIAAKSDQFALGAYNIEDTGEDARGQYAVILGNGSSADNRSNAHTIDWTGKGWFANTVSAGTIETPATVTNANDLTTKAYVDSAVTSSLSLNGNVITLTNSNGATSTITLPVYNGGVTT